MSRNIFLLFTLTLVLLNQQIKAAVEHTFVDCVQCSDVPDPLKDVIKATPKFKGYGFALPENHPCKGAVLTAVSLRPSNFFFEKLFEDSNGLISTTKPGEGLFRFNVPLGDVRRYLDSKAFDSETTVEFSAKGKRGTAKIRDVIVENVNLVDLYGNNTYKLNMKEIIDILESQRIKTSSLLPLEFYIGLKQAMKDDEMVILDANDSNPLLMETSSPLYINDANPLLLKDLVGKYRNCQNFIAQVKNDPQQYGFDSLEAYDELLEMTLYQIGSMVVKSEDYRIFLDGNGKILAREPGENDAIRLINACGIRGFHSIKTPAKYNKRIMTETFVAALQAADEGVVVFPAVGMGVWRGDPDLYWSAFLDAVIKCENNFELICVNPRHQRTKGGVCDNMAGEEFQQYLNKYHETYKNDPQTIEKLNKIINLYDSETDLVQLAYNFKAAFPDKIISLFNASDPDVTLGYHVGEYVNYICFSFTTEENYTAMGTNGLCFEGITLIHAHPERLSQVKYERNSHDKD